MSVYNSLFAWTHEKVKKWFEIVRDALKSESKVRDKNATITSYVSGSQIIILKK